MNIGELNKMVERKKRYEEIELFSFAISFIIFIVMIVMVLVAITSKDTIVAIIAAVCFILYFISLLFGNINKKEKNREISEIISRCTEIKMKNSEIEEIKYLKAFHDFPNTYLKGPYANKNVIIIAVWDSRFKREKEIKICSIQIKEAEKRFDL